MAYNHVECSSSGRGSSSLSSALVTCLRATFGVSASGLVSRERHVDSNKIVLWMSNQLILVFRARFRDEERVIVDI